MFQRFSNWFLFARCQTNQMMIDSFYLYLAYLTWSNQITNTVIHTLFGVWCMVHWYRFIFFIQCSNFLLIDSVNHSMLKQLIQSCQLDQSLLQFRLRFIRMWFAFNLEDDIRSCREWFANIELWSIRIVFWFHSNNRKDCCKRERPTDISLISTNILLVVPTRSREKSRPGPKRSYNQESCNRDRIVSEWDRVGSRA